ncbi:MAG: hypothetical protein RBS40_09030 [Rhodocyclaceae bacterium]|jgi:hypothetical protein|nr:hypothetical protein [Rhodocyclaceae bacterium]
MLFSVVKSIYRDMVTNRERGAKNDQLSRLNVRLESMERSLLAVHHHLNVIKQTAGLIARKNTNVKLKKCRVVFLVHAVEYWSALADVFERMLVDNRFEVVLACVNRRYGENDFYGAKRVSEYFSSRNLQHLLLDDEDSYSSLEILKIISPDYIFRQQQWDSNYQRAFSSWELTFAKTCYLSYGAVMLERYHASGEDGDFQLGYDQVWHRFAHLIFCESEIARSYYLANKHGMPEKYVVTGSPKLRRLLQSCPVWPINRSERGLRVVWAPHHSIGNDWLNFGTFLLVYKEMLAWAQSNCKVEIVLRMHPDLSPRLNTLGNEYEDWHKAWRELPNTYIDEGDPEYGGLFAASDLLITDGVSFLLEYPLFGKPAIFIKRDGHAPFNELGKLAESCCHIVYSASGAIEAAINFSNGENLLPLENLKKLELTVLAQDKNEAGAVVDSIYEDYMQ